MLDVIFVGNFPQPPPQIIVGKKSDPPVNYECSLSFGIPSLAERREAKITVVVKEDVEFLILTSLKNVAFSADET